MHINEKIAGRVESCVARSRTLLLEGKAAESLDPILELLALDADDINVCIYASAQFVDAGTALRDTATIEEGIRLIHRILDECPSLPDEIQMNQIYNLSNGFAALYKMSIEASNTEKAHENIQRQKQLLQSVLIRQDRIPPDLRPALLANYANTLDQLHRTFEAIDHYDECLKVDQQHALARGNCAAAIRRVVAFSGQHRTSNMQVCWDFSVAAVENSENVAEWAGPQAVGHLIDENRRFRLEIEHIFKKGLHDIEDFRRHREVDHLEEPSPSWAEQYRTDRLLLTFNQFPLSSRYEIVDDAFFDTLGSGIGNEGHEKSVELIHLFNAIKEEYVTARHIYYEAQRDEFLASRNDITQYGDPEGDAEFGLLSGLLKASLRTSVDLLDKIAVFIAVYLDLEHPADKYNFNNVWFKDKSPKSGELHPRIAAILDKNFPLRGLRDFQRDFFRDEYPGPVKSVRNAAVHRWIRLSWLPVEKGEQGALSWQLKDFSALALFVLRQAKAAILLLAAAVNLEEVERKKLAGESGRKVISRSLFVRKPVSARAGEELAEEWGAFLEEQEHSQAED